MQPPEIQLPPVLRDRVRHTLAAQAEPLTAAQLARLLLPPGLASAERQTQRALTQLEAAGHATRQRGSIRHIGWAPDQWTSR